MKMTTGVAIARSIKNRMEKKYQNAEKRRISNVPTTKVAITSPMCRILRKSFGSDLSL